MSRIEIVKVDGDHMQFGQEPPTRIMFRTVTAMKDTNGLMGPLRARVNALSNSIKSMSCPRANIIKCLDYPPMARFNFSNLPYVLS